MMSPERRMELWEEYENNEITMDEIIDAAAKDAVKDFKEELKNIAKLNWCPSQIIMLDRLIAAALKHKEYSEVDID